MIDRIAKRIALFLVEGETTPKYDAAAYAYGFSLLMSTALNILFISAIAIWFNCIFGAVLFVLSFVLIRLKGGGYHAKTHARCIALYAATFALTAYAVRIVPIDFIRPAVIVLTALGTVLIWGLAPVAASNKPVTTTKRKKLRAQCLHIACGFMASAVMIYCIPALHSRLIVFLFAGYAAASVSMLIAGIQSRKGERQDERNHV